MIYFSINKSFFKIISIISVKVIFNYKKDKKILYRKRIIAPEIVEYFTEQYNGQDVKVVHGHWPSMVTKNDVDEWVESLAELNRMIMRDREESK